MNRNIFLEYKKNESQDNRSRIPHHAVTPVYVIAHANSSAPMLCNRNSVPDKKCTKPLKDGFEMNSLGQRKISQRILKGIKTCFSPFSSCNCRERNGRRLSWQFCRLYRLLRLHLNRCLFVSAAQTRLGP